MTSPTPLLGVVAALGAVDVAELSTSAELDQHVRMIAVVRAWTDSLLTRASARADELMVSRGLGPGGERTVRGAARLLHQHAAAVARRAAVAGWFPAFAAALHEGSVAGEHLDGLARVVPHLTPATMPEFLAAEADLLACAQKSAPEAFARHVRSLVAIVDPQEAATELDHLERQASMRMWRGRDGMVKFAGTFGPLSGAASVAALDHELAKVAASEANLAEVERRGTDQLRIEALANLINGGHSSRHPGRTTVVVHVGLERLLGEVGGHQACETSGEHPLPIDWVREMAMRAEIVPVLLDRQGQVVELARTATSRLATFLQRVMLRAMYRTCAGSGCEVPFDECEIHHVEPFNGRNTVLANLVPACRPDHGRIHGHGWAFEFEADGAVRTRLPDGTVYDPSPDRPPGASPLTAAA